MKGLLLVAMLVLPSAAAAPLAFDDMLRAIGMDERDIPRSVAPATTAAAVPALPVEVTTVTVALPETPDLSVGFDLQPAFTCSQHGLTIQIQEHSRHLAGLIVVWDWDFGDGSSTSALTRSDNPTRHVYAQPGTYVVTLSVMDHTGLTAATSHVCAGGGVVASVPSTPAFEWATDTPAATPAPRPTCLYELAADGTCPAAAPTVAPVPQVPEVPVETARPPPTFVPAAVPLPAAPTQDVTPVAAAAIGITTLGAAALWVWLRRLLPFGPLALFTRLKQDELLEHPVRNQIVQLVESRPGIHYQAIARTLERGNGVLEHHLRMLTTAGLVRERASSGYTCYFPAAMDRRLMDMHAVLKSDVARQVLEEVLRQPGRPVSHVAETVGVTPKAVTYHLNRFAQAGLVSLERQGRTVLAFANPLAQETPVAA